MSCSRSGTAAWPGLVNVKYKTVAEKKFGQKFHQDNLEGRSVDLYSL
jgi:hypothetical protein